MNSKQLRETGEAIQAETDVKGDAHWEMSEIIIAADSLEQQEKIWMIHAYPLNTHSYNTYIT